MSEVGRPALFTTNKELEIKISEYFELLKGEFHFEADSEDESKDIKVWDKAPEPPSITGMALFLGFESRQSLYDYEKNDVFSYTIKRARLTIEVFYEQNLLGRGVTGAIFALKNFGWKDRQELDHSGDISFLWNEVKTYDDPDKETNPSP